MASTNDEAERGLSLGQPTMVDRRRPGRSKQVDPGLLPLLRGDFDPAVTIVDMPYPELGDSPDPLNAAKGIGTGLLMSGVLWAGIIYVTYKLF